MITSSANRDSFHALNPNSNLNANPTYIYNRQELMEDRSVEEKFYIVMISKNVRRCTIVTPISYLMVLVSIGAKKSTYVSRMYQLVCLQIIAYPRSVGISQEAVKRILREGLHPYVHASTS